MAIERFQYTQPAKYQGIEDYLPTELQEFGLELVRRLAQNTDGLVSSVRDQVVVDKQILTIQSGGQDSGTTVIVATSADTDGVLMEAILWSA